MSRLFTIFAHGFLTAACVLGSHAFAAQPQTLAKLPAHKAFTRPATEGASCMNNSRRLSHVSYLPVDPSQTLPCGHLLSTDTVLTVHHWDRT